MTVPEINIKDFPEIINPSLFEVAIFDGLQEIEYPSWLSSALIGINMTLWPYNNWEEGDTCEASIVLRFTRTEEYKTKDLMVFASSLCSKSIEAKIFKKDKELHETLNFYVSAMDGVRQANGYDQGDSVGVVEVSLICELVKEDRLNNENE